MTRLELPPIDDVPNIQRFLEGTRNYDMDHHLRLIYHPIYGIFFQERFVMALAALDRCCTPRPRCLVEIGYGQGLLFPTLSGMASRVIGVDTLTAEAASCIDQMLRRLQITNISLLSGTVWQIPLADRSVDTLLCLSTLEHLHSGKELDGAIAEIVRVLRFGGSAVLGFPVKNKLTRLLLKMVGINDAEVHPSSHRDIIASCGQPELGLEAVRRFPAFCPMDLSLYALIQLRRTQPAA